MTLNSIRSMRLVQYSIGVLVLNLLFAGVTLASQQSVPVPQVNANLGPCTVDFTVSEKAKQPLFNAEISVKIAYGFMGVKKDGLEGRDQQRRQSAFCRPCRKKSADLRSSLLFVPRA